MIRTSDSTKLLTAALHSFHERDVRVPKDSVNTFFKSNYADLAAIKTKCDPVLVDLGLVITQFPGVHDTGAPTLITRLCHAASGEFMEAETPLKLPKDNPQAQGSAITYMRRYAYSAVLGVVADPDDDGEKAMQRGRKAPKERYILNNDPMAQVKQETLAAHDDQPDPPSVKQLNYLNALIRDNGLADSDVELMVAQHTPPWPGGVDKLSKRQVSVLIDKLK